MYEGKPAVENNEKISSKIELHFFRHSIKGPVPPDGQEPQTRLTDKGRILAVERSYQDVNHTQALAFGSPRDRTQETVGFVMAGSRDDITGQETLEELKEKINKDLKIGSKIGIDTRLNFTDDPTSPVGKMLEPAINEGTYLKALIETSDDLARETGDMTGATYSEKAAQIAKIIEKYLAVAPRWNKLVEEKSNQYTPNLERYFSTHQAMQESFLAKVIEKTKGLASRNDFISIVGNQGFDFIEGFEADLVTKQNGEIALHVRYSKDKDGKHFKFDQDVPLKIIQEIIKEGDIHGKNESE